jgi:phage terminase large subunit
MTREAARARKAVARYRRDPVAFAAEVLGVELWSRQAEIAQSVADHRRTAVRSGHKIGKSTDDVVLAYWWLMTRPRSRVVLLTSSAEFLKNNLWKEAQRIYREAPYPLGPELALDPATGWRLPDGRQMIGMAPRHNESVGGLGGPNQLFIVDEPTAVSPALFPAIEGAMAAEGCKLVMTGNPLLTSGPFFDAFHSDRDRWHCLHVSSLEAVAAGVLGLATQEWVDEMRAKHGADSPIYAARVLGEFPRQQSNAVVALADVEACMARYRATQGGQVGTKGPLEAGLDVARFGDDSSVLVLRRGSRVIRVTEWSHADSVNLAGLVVTEIGKVASPTETTKLRVDVTGVGGGVVDQLWRLAKANRIDMQPVNFSWRARDRKQFANARAELWWALANWLREPTSELPRNERLTTELVAPTYMFNQRGQIMVEAKDAIKRRIGRSPDLAEALALSVYGAVGVRPETEHVEAWANPMRVI